MTRIARLGLGSAVGLILVATLTPVAGPTSGLWHWCVLCGGRGGIDALQNIVLFFPLGVVLRTADRPVRVAAVVGALLSTTVELLQWRLDIGRDAALGDVVMNTAGCMLGAALTPLLRVVLAPTIAQARVCAIVGAMTWGALVSLCDWLVVPWIPAGPFISEWGGIAPQPERRFDGSVLHVDLNGIPLLPLARVEPAQAVREALRAPVSKVRAEVIPGTVSSRAVFVFDLTGPFTAVVSISQAGRDLLCARSVRADRLRLRSPHVLVRDILMPGDRGARADTLRFECNLDAGRVVARALMRGQRGESVLPLTPGVGATVLLPDPGEVVTKHPDLAYLWLALLSVPMGFWSARFTSGRRRRAMGMLAAISVVVGVALDVVPRVLGTLAAPPSEHLAVIAGVLIGAAGGAFRRPAESDAR